jgi:hypothetical protein
MLDDSKQVPPKYGFLLDELHQQGFLVGVGDVLKVHHYFSTLWEHPLPISDLKAQLAALVCQNPQQQKLFYAWFDKWAVIIEKRTENLIAQLEPIEAEKAVPTATPTEKIETPVEPPPPPPNVANSQNILNNTFMSAPPLKKRKGPINIQLNFPRNPIRFWNLTEFDAVLPILREKKWVESTEWDIRASIKRTIKMGGSPQFVPKQKRQTPQYLMLIEQQSNRDHLAAFYADLAEELSQRDLNVTFFYYDINPAICWRERNNPRSQVPLEQLQGEFADARLFIVGHAETLLKPAQLEPSAVALSIAETWKETAVLCPKSTGDWGKAELALGQLFPVIPANGLGFQSLSAQWQGTEHFTPTYWQLNSPEPRTPNVAEFVTSPRPKGENTEGLPSWKTVTPEDENQLNLLYFYLRDGGYRWLCAAALYPEIYYELTRLYADEVIAKNQQLSEWEQNRLWGESLRLLVRLDWFRKGQIPTHWRGLLRDDFSIERALALQNPQFELSVKEVRRQLLDVLKLPANTEGVPEDSYAAANQAFTQVWIEAEIANNLADIPQKMTDLEISMSDIEDAVGQQLWFTEGAKAESKRAKTLYAVIVGIDKYAMSSLALQGCQNDAKAMNDYLYSFCAANSMDYKPTVLFDERAKRIDIINSFNEFNDAQDGDICVFYFAGRGAQITAPPEFADEADGLSEVLVCYDSQMGNKLDGELADTERAYLIYKTTKGKNLHFLSITDACHSGEDDARKGGKTAVSTGAGVKAADYLGFETYINYQPPTANYVHLGAAQSNETTKELTIDGGTRGAFTFALVKTLEENKGQITYKDLLNRVKKDVQERVKEQTPTLSVHGWPSDTPFLGIKPKDPPKTDPLSKKPQAEEKPQATPEAVPDGQEAVINADSVRVYEDAGSVSKIVATKTRGDVVYVSEIRENWCRIGEKQWVTMPDLGVKVAGLSEKEAAEIKDLVAKAKLESALNAFLDWAKTHGNKDIENAIFVKTSEYSQLKKDENLGLLSNSDANTRRNRITDSILNLLDESKEETIIPFTTPSVTNDFEADDTLLFVSFDGTNEQLMIYETDVYNRIQKVRKDKFKLEFQKNKRLNDLTTLIGTYKPRILHLFGRGFEDGLDDTYQGRKDMPFDAKSLNHLFETVTEGFKIKLKVVVLDGCHTERDAAIISKYADVIGYSKAVKREVALNINEEFYKYVAEGLDVEQAFRIAKMQSLQSAELTLLDEQLVFIKRQIITNSI